MRYFLRKRKLAVVAITIGLLILVMLQFSHLNGTRQLPIEPHVPDPEQGGRFDSAKHLNDGDDAVKQPIHPVPAIEDKVFAVKDNHPMQKPGQPDMDYNEKPVRQIPIFPEAPKQDDYNHLERPNKDVLKEGESLPNNKPHSSIDALKLYPREPPPKSTSDSKGPGEGGKPYTVDRKELSKLEIAKIDEGWKTSAFDNYASDRISVRRYLPDFREGKCKADYDPKYLPQTAVVICFHNEAWTTLLRSVHSVIDNSPPELIKEIVLVDDASDQIHLKDALEEYMARYSFVKIVRAKQREGLIRARMMGVRHSTAPIITFLDSHIECTTGWLEPLLARIAESETNVVVPIIEVISDETFAFRGTKASAVQVGGFSWNLIFHWHFPPKRDRIRPGAPYSPVRSPTMAGGLFSISREFFKKLGYYDEGMEVWGGENLEISFKTWMCGGTLETVVCSHVGHVFRKRSPYKWDSKFQSPLTRNTMRLAEVWLDDYKKFYLAQTGNRNIDYGDISDRIALRNSLNCKSFKWYLDTIYPELFVPSKALAHGDIENKQTKYCIDGASDSKFLIPYHCHQQGGNQFWLLSPANEIRRDLKCWDSGYKDNLITVSDCHGQGGNQHFLYDDEGHIKQGNRCVELSTDSKTISLQLCSDSPYQKWNFDRRPYMDS